MMFVPLLFSVFAFLFASTAHAQSGAGNGGRAMVCPGSVEVYDYWEARNDAQIEVSLGGPKLEPEEKVELIIARVRRVDPEFAVELEERLNAYRNSHEIQDRVEITEIDDAKEYLSPKDNCYSVQAVINKRIVDQVYRTKFLLVREVWKLMNSDQRAGLIFHEILYWSEIERGAADSLGVRRLNGILSSEAGLSLTQAAYISLLQKYSVRRDFLLKRARISIASADQPGFSPQGNLISGKLIEETPFSIDLFRSEHPDTRVEGTCVAGSVATFDSQGNITDCKTENPVIHHETEIGKQTLFLQGEYSGLRFLDTQSIKLMNVEIRSSEFAQLWSINLSAKYPLLVLLTPEFGIRSIQNLGAHQKPKIPFLTTNIRMENAILSGVAFAASGRINHLWIEAKPQPVANLYDLPQGSRYELGWKDESTSYEIELDEVSKKILKIR